MATRRQNLTARLREVKADAFLILALPNVHYLSGFTGSNGAVLLTGDRNLLFTDPRYQTQAPQESDCDVKIAKGPLITEVASWIKRLKLKAIAFEQNRISFDEHRQIHAAVPAVKLRPVSGAVERLRMVKSEAEIGTIRASV